MTQTEENDNAGKMAIWSDYYIEEDFDDKPTTVKISKVVPEEKTMSSGMSDDLKKYINASLEVFDASLEATKAKVVIDKRNRLTALQGLGDIVKGVVKFIPGQPNPMVENLHKLERKIEELGEKTTEHFVEMKSFITEIKFFLKITSPTAVLTKCMRDCLKNPGPEAVDNFRMAYRKTPPLKLAYKLISFLEQKTLNPLKLAMDAQKVNTEAEFAKWEDMIVRILGQFLFLEAFGVGILGVQCDFSRNVLIDRTLQVLQTIEQWKREYGVDEHYWEEMRAWLEDYMPKHEEKSNQEKAEEIAKKLKTYKTTDAFYVIVFNESDWQKDYIYVCQNEKTQILEVLKKGKRCAIIYRSREAYKIEPKEYDRMIKDSRVIAVDQTKRLNYYGTLEKVIEHQLINTRLVRADGLVFLCDMAKCRPDIQHANCKEVTGPGYGSPVKMNVHVEPHGVAEKMLLVGFP